MIHRFCIRPSWAFLLSHRRCRAGPALAECQLLEVPAEGLLALDGLEERREVPLAQGRRAVPLDHLEEDRRPVLRGLREDLEQVAVLVAVGQDLQAVQVLVVLADLSDASFDLFVVGVRGIEEAHAAVLERLDGADDVVALHRDVLHARPVVELEVLLDLALALALGRLVDRELDLAAAVSHHLRHQRGVLGLDLVVAEVDDVRHPEDALVELHPVVHTAELDVSDDVIEKLQGDPGRGLAVLDRRPVAGEVGARVVLAVHEGVDDVAVGRDRRELDSSVLVFGPVRLGDALRAALDRLPVGLGGARDAQRDALRGVAVTARELGDLAVGTKAAREHEPDLLLLEHVRGAVANSGLRASVRRRREAERLLVVVGGLLRVPDPELDVIPAFERHEVVGAHVSDLKASRRETCCGRVSSPTTTSSSSPRRRGTSRTQSSEITKTSAERIAAARNARRSASASARRPAAGRRWIAVPSARTPGGKCWLTITPISVTPSVAPIERENCESAVAVPIARLGTEF